MGSITSNNNSSNCFVGDRGKEYRLHRTQNGEWRVEHANGKTACLSDAEYNDLIMSTHIDPSIEFGIRAQAESCITDTITREADEALLKKTRDILKGSGSKFFVNIVQRLGLTSDESRILLRALYGSEKFEVGDRGIISLNTDSEESGPKNGSA
jgi:hypothetical protein